VNGELRSAVTALVDALPRAAWALSETELVDGLDLLHALAQQVAAVQLALVREVDARAVATRQGATSTKVWLRDRLRVSGASADRMVRLAVALDGPLPATGAALAAGAVTVEQAWQIASVVAALPAQAGPEVAARAEAVLVRWAGELDPAGLRAAGGRILQHVAPELADAHERARLEAAERHAHQARQVTLASDGQGGVRLRGLLDEAGAAVVRAAVDPLCVPSSDGRSPGQRRADALVEVCGLALAGGTLPDHGGDRPQVVVTVAYDVLAQKLGVGMLDTGVRLSAAQVRRLACDAGLVPAVLGGAGQVLDLGRERRRFTGPLRRALVLRDRGCAFPGCDRPPQWTAGHHIVHWSDGGPTCLANGVLLCGHHHRVVHTGEWVVRIAADGLPEFLPPAWLDPLQRPRRNHRHPPPDS
jgi:hypothetical protein